MINNLSQIDSNSNATTKHVKSKHLVKLANTTFSHTFLKIPTAKYVKPPKPTEHIASPKHSQNLMAYHLLQNSAHSPPIIKF